jgi:pimeloyl-ACP methyl ester carboxylesterase
MNRRKQGFVNVGGVRLFAVEEGEGPLVILVHGFPESWYSWRRQLSAIAALGYRVVAYDQRGYGRSSKFARSEAYGIEMLVRDLVGLITALGERQAILIGHDWGAPVVWTASWAHPEMIRGVLGMCVPFSGRGLIALPGNPFGERCPDDMHREMAGPGQDFYQVHFGRLDAIIDEIEADLAGWVRDLTWTVSGDALAAAGMKLTDDNAIELTRASALCVKPGERMRDRFLTPPRLPPWFTAADLDFYVNELERSGFFGPLSYYRNLQANWQALESLSKKPLIVPAMFLGGEYDVGTWWGLEAIERASECIPNWMGSHIIDGSGHWIQQERAEQTNVFVAQFLSALR